jgi:hypothetical protein
LTGLDRFFGEHGSFFADIRLNSPATWCSGAAVSSAASLSCRRSCAQRTAGNQHVVWLELLQGVTLFPASGMKRDRGLGKDASDIRGVEGYDDSEPGIASSIGPRPYRFRSCCTRRIIARSSA